MTLKQRQARGERVSTATLTGAAVVEIRKKLSAGRTQRDLAREFGVSQGAVSQIARSFTWRHLPSVEDLCRS